ncbi:MAG: cell division protein FtsB [Betaproteobacteria bacterium]|nr:cell division protein FtsB [Betaproteobacteria bacterium]
MRWPVFLLFVLVIALQYPLWLGRGGWLRVWEIDKSLQEQRAHNQRLEQRNARLDAEVNDLKSGTDAIEERARYDLGLVRPGEVFVQVPQKPETPQKPVIPEEPAPVSDGRGEAP